MTPSPTTPVLVGVAVHTHRPSDGEVPDLLTFMESVARTAADDAGAPALLERIGWIGVPKGAWGHPDPGRLVAAAIGSPAAHTVLAEVGVLQQELLDRAAAAVQAGAGAALLVGAETSHGSTAGAAGSVIAARGAPSEPDEHLITADLGVSPAEVGAGFYDPPAVYAVLESAWAADRGWTASEHRSQLGRLCAGFAGVAATNPWAWIRDGIGAEAIVVPSEGNRMVASPYTKLCCSNLRVNQAVALLFTTVADARAAGVPEDRWVYPWAGAVSNHAVPVAQRPELGRSPNARAAGRSVLDHACLSVDEVDHLDLYSCFPAAVQIAAGELGISLDRQLTVTGGMTFAGGPLNSYALQSTARMAEVLRAEPGRRGLVTSVSGFLTKYGAGVWSSRPPERPWRSDDVTTVAAAEPGCPDAPADELTGPFRVLGATVAHDRDGGRQLLAVAETGDGTRTLVSSDDEQLVARAVAEELVGTSLQL